MCLPNLDFPEKTHSRRYFAKGIIRDVTGDSIMSPVRSAAEAVACSRLPVASSAEAV